MIYTLLLTMFLGLGAGTPAVDPFSEAARLLTEDFAAGRFAEAEKRFVPESAAQLPAARLEAIWKQLTAASGEWEKIHAIRNEDADSIPIRIVTGAFSAGGIDIRLAFTPEGLVRGILFQPAGKPGWTKPDYVDETTFTEEERVVKCPEGDLPARLTLPKGEGNVPGLVLVHGSGPHDPDESVGPNKPFRDLAAGLSSRGIAVLRYTKRTRAHGGKMTTFTLDNETVDDAVTAAELLKTEARVDPAQIFVLGHSQGGYGLPRIAKRFPGGCGWICLAGNSRPLEELIVEQYKHILSNTPEAATVAPAQIAAIEVQAARVRKGEFTAQTPKTELPAGFTAEWFLNVKDYNPADLAATLPGRWLFLQGGRDYQVTEADLNGWKKAFSAAKRTDATFKLYPPLNHLFFAGEGICLPAEYRREASVAKEVVEDIAGFILGGEEKKD